MNKDGHLTIKHGVSAVTGYFLSDFQIEEVLCLYRRLDCMFTLLSIVGRQQSRVAGSMKGQGFFFTPIYACMHVNSIGFIVYNFQVPKNLNYHQTNWELTKGLGLDMNEYASS